MKKINYFYIDEAGSLGNDSKIFVHGCIKTDSPNILENALKFLRQDLIDELYFDGFVDRIINEGFHAVENHPDVRTHFYKLLPILDYRAYFVIVDKTSPFYTQLLEEQKEYEIFEYSLKKLLKDRIVKNKNDKNIFYFERIDIKKKSLNSILKDFFQSIDNEFDCEYHIVGKEMENLSVVDYLNYVFIQILEGFKSASTKAIPKSDRMKLNFDLISPKIGVINILHNDTFLSRKKRINKRVEYNNLLNAFGG